jgi:hypothetical protein
LAIVVSDFEFVQRFFDSADESPVRKVYIKLFGKEVNTGISLFVVDTHGYKNFFIRRRDLIILEKL